MSTTTGTRYITNAMSHESCLVEKKHTVAEGIALDIRSPEIITSRHKDITMIDILAHMVWFFLLMNIYLYYIFFTHIQEYSMNDSNTKVNAINQFSCILARTPPAIAELKSTRASESPTPTKALTSTSACACNPVRHKKRCADNEVCTRTKHRHHAR